MTRGGGRAEAKAWCHLTDAWLADEYARAVEALEARQAMGLPCGYEC